MRQQGAAGKGNRGGYAELSKWQHSWRMCSDPVFDVTQQTPVYIKQETTSPPVLSTVQSHA